MSEHEKSSRRKFLKGAALAAGGAALSGCGDAASRNKAVQKTLASVDAVNNPLQHFLAGKNGLAREFSEKDISPVFRANGTLNPRDAEYRAHALEGFENWRVAVDGLVERPLDLSLGDLRAFPSRTQITRHDCVEGWSCIGKWKGARLAALLDAARPKAQAKYAVFHCADTLGSSRYYESVALADARHEQTILAYEMNDAPLDIPHGAPVRLRVERMLGYKHAKYVMRVELASSLETFGRGKGGHWEDRGYAWYAGI